MRIHKYTFWLLITNIIILPILGNDSLNSFLHIGFFATLTNYLLPLIFSILLFLDYKNSKTKFKLNFSNVISIILIIILLLSFIFSITHRSYNISNLFKFCVFIYLLNILKDIKLYPRQTKILNFSIIGLLIFLNTSLFLTCCMTVI